MHTHKCCLILLFICVEGVFGAAPDVMKSVTEGDSVTLNTDVTELQRDDQILWMFGPKETRIAEIYKLVIDMFNSHEIFGDRLKLDNQTGSLTIRNTRSTDSGLYKRQIRSNRGNSDKIFNVTVYAHLPVPVINTANCASSERSSVPRCSLVCSVVNVGHVTLSWYKGNSLLSSISVSDLSISLSLPLEVEYQDKNSYSCVLNNPISNQTQHLDITQLCKCPDIPSSSSSVTPSLIYAVVGVASVALLVCYVRSRMGVNKKKPASQPHSRHSLLQTRGGSNS
ncbi:SLAM family member 9 isoform X3 [Carassius gibelio]|uniref:SLAM family member 9 isoform X1 n=1 Tax=Carassius gibelio TaxID=101364 RepID=UPI0022797792|nr:SLAM family member 9 isoform X1 [Carassius gibelio]XP_052394941.1 SLAM family member 9 isoform X2 [Carassius gibelio]XP_052394942.1 SLAM family member 9 isoform X3 [Carassius gibelio]